MAKKPREWSNKASAEKEIAKQLDALYAELPALNCKGKCWKCCTAVLMAPGERDRVLREGGVALPTVDGMRREKRELCPALESHRCTVYTARPMMCRLWGIAETMRCPYGCVPDGGWLTEEEATKFWLRTYAIAGWPVEKKPRLNRRQVLEHLHQHEKAIAKRHESEPVRERDPRPGERTGRRLRLWNRSSD